MTQFVEAQENGNELEKACVERLGNEVHSVNWEISTWNIIRS
jgi:hypothetical protein